MSDANATPVVARRGLLAVFRHPLFVTIWAAAAISNIGNWMENVAQGWSVIQQTHDDPAHQAFLTELLSVADFAPVLFFSLIAGVIADRVNRKRWLIFLQAMACLLATLLAVLAYMGLATPWVVIAVTFAEGVIWAFNAPVWLTVVPSLVPRAELEFATAATSLQFNLARMIGPVIAGILIGISSVSVAFAINALTFIPVLIALAWLPDRPAPVRTVQREGLFKEIFSGVRYTWGHRGARRLAIMAMSFAFLSAPVQGLLPVFAKQVLGGTPTLYGLMLAAIGLGSVTGAFSLSRIPAYYPRHHLIPLAMSIFCGFGILYTCSHTPWLSLLLLYCAGIFWLLTLNPMNTATQLLATDENRGRMMSVMMLCMQGTMPIGHLVAGALSYAFSPENVLRVMLAPMLLLALYYLFRREPAIDQMERRDLPRLTLMGSIHEAITAESHRPISAADNLEIHDPNASSGRISGTN